MPVIADPEDPQPADQSTSLMLDFANDGFILDDLGTLADAGRSQSDIGTLNIHHWFDQI